MKTILIENQTIACKQPTVNNRRWFLDAKEHNELSVEDIQWKTPAACATTLNEPHDMQPTETHRKNKFPIVYKQDKCSNVGFLNTRQMQTTHQKEQYTPRN